MSENEAGSMPESMEGEEREQSMLPTGAEHAPDGIVQGEGQEQPGSVEKTYPHQFPERIELDDTVHRYFEQGYKPIRRPPHGRIQVTTITLRHPNGRETTLGAYNVDLWNQLSIMYSKWLADTGGNRRRLPPPSESKKRGGLMDVNLSKHPALNKSIPISEELLLYYDWAKDKGFVEKCHQMGLKGDFSDFVGQTIRAYFTEHGVQVQVSVESE